MTMPLTSQIIIIAVVVLGTMATRFIPFLVFPPGRGTSEYVSYLGKVLPSATLALLVVYSFRNVDLLGARHGMPEFLAGAVVVGLHVWRRSMMLSIAGGTVAYMLIIHVF